MHPSSCSAQAPQIVSLYALNISPSMIRVKKRADFERHREISDLNVIDMLIFKSRQEYQETMNCWKTEVRVYSGRMGGRGREATMVQGERDLSSRRPASASPP